MAAQAATRRTAQNRSLPQWTWEDLEAALDGFSPSGGNDPLRDHLIRGLEDEAERATPRELLQQVLSAGWVMAQVGARTSALSPVSATDPRHATGAPAS